MLSFEACSVPEDACGGVEDGHPAENVRLGVAGISDDVAQKAEDLVSMLQNFFPLSLTVRPNKLGVFPLETLSSQVLEFEG
jgi:hypothetical protein